MVDFGVYLNPELSESSPARTLAGVCLPTCAGLNRKPKASRCRRCLPGSTQIINKQLDYT